MISKPITRGSVNTARRRRALEAFGHAAGAIGPITADTNLFLVTRGQFSMLDMIRHCLDELGPASIAVWTWTISEYDVADELGGLISDRRVQSARLVVDASAERMRSERARAVELWRDRFGPESVRVCSNHAKIARVWTPARRVLLRGSMNLNVNRRFEQCDLTVDGPDFDLVAEIEAGLPVLAPFADRNEADQAAKVSAAAELADLTAFQGLRTWAP